jgi:hypothetical protein
MAAKKGITPPAREAFILYVRQWQERLNLHDWRISVSAKPAAKANAAEVAILDLEARLASIRIGTDFGSLPIDDQSLDEFALHEVLHIFLFEFKSLCRHECVVAEDVLMSSEHRLIHSLVHVLAKGG